MNPKKKITVAQILPSLNSGGVERGTIEIADYLIKNGQKSIVISGGGRLVQNVIETGSLHINLNVGKKSPSILFLIPKLLKIIIENQIDIIHARSRLPAWLVYITLKFIPKKDRPFFLTTVHGLNRVSLYSKIMTKGDKVIVVSKFIKNFIISTYKINKEKIFLIYRGVPLKLQKQNNINFNNWLKKWEVEYPYIKKKKVLILSARLSRTKGVEIFIDLIKNLIEENFEVHGLIVGEAKSDNYLKIIKNKIDDLNLSDDISITGFREDIYSLLQYSHISFCLSTLPEPFGRVVIESIKIGTPVIGFNIGGCGEQLKNIFPRGLVELNDMTTLIAKTKEFINKKPPVKKTDLYTMEEMQSRTLKVYQSFFK